MLHKKFAPFAEDLTNPQRVWSSSGPSTVPDPEKRETGRSGNRLFGRIRTRETGFPRRWRCFDRRASKSLLPSKSTVDTNKKLFSLSEALFLPNQSLVCSPTSLETRPEWREGGLRARPRGLPGPLGHPGAPGPRPVRPSPRTWGCPTSWSRP